MSQAASSSRKKRRPFYEASEPRGYDRRFYAGVLLVAFLLILAVVGFAVYRTAFNTETPQPGPVFDLSSLYTGGSGLPDPANPCIVLQEHLEATRTSANRKAYGCLCQGLKKITSFDQFVSNARTDRLLFREVAGYRFARYKINGTAASATGFITYKTGGSSKVDAQFAREEGSWRIALMTVIYQ